MNKINIEINYKHKEFKISKKKINELIILILDYLKLRDIELNIYLCSDNYIKPVNKKFRNVNEPTDVLSFSLNENNPENGLLMLGELLVSVESIIRQSKEYSVSIESEFSRMTVHGILHLTGMTHNTPARKKAMFTKTEKILAYINSERIFEI